MPDWGFPNFDGMLTPPPDDDGTVPHQPDLGDQCPCDDCHAERREDDREAEEDDDEE